MSNSDLSAVSSQTEVTVQGTVVAEEVTPRNTMFDAVIEPSAPITSNEHVPAPPASGWMNGLFETNSSPLTGPDAPALLVGMGPLYRAGSSDRAQFDRAHEVVVQVSFKIHTGNEVVVNEPSDSAIATTSKGSVARRPVGTTVNVIDSKVFNDGVVHELRSCLVGLSLNQFKELCAELCERYAPGMHQMVLNSDVAPSLIWKASVGRTAPGFVLGDYVKYFDFVTSVTKSRTRRATLLIHSECSKAVAKKKARASASHKLIASANTPQVLEVELAKANERADASDRMVALHLSTADLFRMHAETGNAGGDGVVMTAPWNPNYHYRFTLACAYIWAKAIDQGETTKHMPPNSSEYRTEIAKTKIEHPGLKLKDRLRLRFPTPKASRIGNVSTSKKRLYHQSPTRNGKNKIDLVSSSPPKHDIKPFKFELRDEKVGSPSNKKPVSSSALEGSIKKAKKDPDSSSGEEEAPSSEPFMSSADTDELEILKEHEHLLDQFVKECGVHQNFDRTRNILLNSGIKSWLDLVPSVKMTTAVLIEQGIPREIAHRMLQKAEERNDAEMKKINKSDK